MGDERQQNKSCDPGRIGKRKSGRDRSPQRMAKEHEALDADAVESLRDQCGLPCRRSVCNASRPVTPAMSRAIDQNYAAANGKPAAKGEVQVFEIAARTMHQHDRESLLLRRSANLHHMQPAALDLDEPPRSRMGSLDSHRFDDRNSRASSEERRHSEEKE